MEQKQNYKNLSEMSLEELQAMVTPNMDIMLLKEINKELYKRTRNPEMLETMSIAVQKMRPEIDEEVLQMNPEEREAKAAKILEEINNMKF